MRKGRILIIYLSGYQLDKRKFPLRNKKMGENLMEGEFVIFQYLISFAVSFFQDHFI